MEQLTLGDSGIAVTRLCLGTWNMGGQAGWGPKDEEDAVALVRHALDSGCNFVDTARSYGRGKSEEVVGKAVAGRRDHVVIATKMLQCRAEEVGPNIEASLHALQTDYVDLYICHWPVPSLPMEAFFEQMVRQREAGKIRAIGVSNFNLAQMQVALRHGVVSLQPPFSILWRAPDGVLDFCREHRVSVTPYSPLAQGLLTGRYTRQKSDDRGGPRRHNLLFSDQMFPHSLKAAARVDQVADKLGCTSAQVALAWVLRTPGITSVLVGASSPAQWDQNIGALDVALAEEDYRALDQAGLEVWHRFQPEDAMWGWKPA
jgi:aryl-alcohol dehydrogenase-like predicted oxidoreductase